jgi:uncharacterized protein (DUF3820 family)
MKQAPSIHTAPRVPVDKKEYIQHGYKEDRYAKMPRGKYRGFFLKDVPTDYLKWCVMNYTEKGLAQWLADELMRRPDVKKELNKINPQ